jgi:hypothetical protein
VPRGAGRRTIAITAPRSGRRPRRLEAERDHRLAVLGDLVRRCDLLAVFPDDQASVALVEQREPHGHDRRTRCIDERPVFAAVGRNPGTVELERPVAQGHRCEQRRRVRHALRAPFVFLEATLTRDGAAHPGGEDAHACETQDREQHGARDGRARRDDDRDQEDDDRDAGKDDDRPFLGRSEQHPRQPEDDEGRDEHTEDRELEWVQSAAADGQVETTIRRATVRPSRHHPLDQGHGEHDHAEHEQSAVDDESDHETRRPERPDDRPCRRRHERARRGHAFGVGG